MHEERRQLILHEAKLTRLQSDVVAWARKVAQRDSEGLSSEWARAKLAVAQKDLKEAQEFTSEPSLPRKVETPWSKLEEADTVQSVITKVDHHLALYGMPSTAKLMGQACRRRGWKADHPVEDVIAAVDRRLIRRGLPSLTNIWMRARVEVEMEKRDVRWLALLQSPMHWY